MIHRTVLPAASEDDILIKHSNTSRPVAKEKPHRDARKLSDTIRPEAKEQPNTDAHSVKALSSSFSAAEKASNSVKEETSTEKAAPVPDDLVPARHSGANQFPSSLPPDDTSPKRSGSSTELGDASIDFDDTPAQDMIHSQPVPTIDAGQDLRLESSHDSDDSDDDEKEPRRIEQASAPAQESMPVNNTRTDFDPSDVVKPSLAPVAEPDDTRRNVSRMVAVACLVIGIVLLLVTLVVLVTNTDVVHPDPRIERAIAVRDASEQVLQSLMKTLAAAAAAISTRSSSLEWPVLDDFELLASMTTAGATMLCPVVASDRRQEWQSFAKNNTDWVATSRTMVEALDRIERRRLQNGSAVLDSVTVDDADTDGGSAINDTVGAADGGGVINFGDQFKPDVGQPSPNDGDPGIDVPFAIHGSPRGGPLARGDAATEYLPVWQLSPVPEEDLSIINFDVLRQPMIRRLFEESKTTKRAVVSPLFGNSRVLFDDAFAFDGTLKTASPQFAILQPVFNRIAQPNIIDAYLLTVYDWLDLSWKSPFPAKLVVDNNCGSGSYAYELSQNGSQYLGEESTQPDDDFVSTTFAAFSNGTSMCEYSLYFRYDGEVAENGESRPIVSHIVLVVALIFVLIGAAGLIAHDANRRHVPFEQLANQGIRKQGDELGQLHSVRRSIGKMKDDNVNDQSLLLESVTANATVVVRSPGKYADEAVSLTNFFMFVLLFSMPHLMVRFHHTQFLTYSTFGTSCCGIGFSEWSATSDDMDAFSLLDHLNSTFDRLVTEYKLSKVSCSGDAMVRTNLFRLIHGASGRYCWGFVHSGLWSSTTTGGPRIRCFLFFARVFRDCQ
jgi:hypothetical protein